MSDDMQGALPPGWIVTDLDHIAEMVRGVSYPKSEASDTPVDGKLPILRATNIQDTTLILDHDLVYVPAHRIAEEQYLMLGDIVVCMSSGSKHLVGKAAQLSSEWHGSFGTFCAVARPNKEIEPKYLGYYLQSPNYREFIREQSSGININNLRQSDIAKLEIPTAPLNEQCRIVAKIEELLTRLDAGVAALKRAQANLKRYKASVLKAACEGKLVPTEAELARAEGRTYEPADELLKRILSERRSKWEADLRAKGKDPSKVKYIEPQPPDISGLPELPEGWTTTSVDSLTTRITSGSRDWTQYYGRGTGTFLMAQNVRLGQLDLSYRQQVDPPRNSADRERSQVYRGDLLVTIVGANTGNVCQVTKDLPEHYVCQSVALMRPVRLEVADYLHTYLISTENGQAQYKRYIYGAGRPHLDFDQLRQTAIQLPPPPEQSRIITEVERRLFILARIEVSIIDNLARAERLRQSILRRAFSGKLVRQDPNDEPAGALLERIHAASVPQQLTFAGEPASPRRVPKTKPSA